ncbi:MAG: hypothetical protein M1401_18800 [Chloroflexi bacterium]|nr:hypothetical protein [Chloroflexota bacterium]
MGGLNGLELFYWVAFLFGLGYGVFGLLAGGLGGHDIAGGHDVDLSHDLGGGHELDAGHDVGAHHVSPVNSLTIAAFSLAVGGIGLLTYRYIGLPDWLSLLLATVGAVLVAGAFFLAVWRPLVRAQGSSSPDMREVAQALAKVRVSIPAEGLGEIVFSARGSRMQLPARSASGVPLASGTRVAIVRLHKGVAEVVSMEDEALGSASDEG